jgi:hypothetical protein
MYTGPAIASKSSGNFIYAADLANTRVDMYVSSFNLVTSFTDSTLPAGNAPFGIQDINGLVYVAFVPVNEAPRATVDIFRKDGRS